MALKGVNEDEIDDLLRWCGDQGFDLTLIETMPMGDIDGDRTDQYLPLSVVRGRLKDRWTLRDIDYKTGGPARYVEVAETGGRLGFITPMTHNFCESCNRVRITCTGMLYMCLGQDDSADLRAPLRASESDGLLVDAIHEAIGRKPKGHDFIIDRRNNRPAVTRHMSVTGGLSLHTRDRDRRDFAVLICRQGVAPWTPSIKTFPALRRRKWNCSRLRRTSDRENRRDSCKPATQALAHGMSACGFRAVVRRHRI